MWTCPDCQRSFKNTHQQHTCSLISRESLFLKRPPHLFDLYHVIRQYVEHFAHFREETVRPDVIFFKEKSTFLAVKVKKDHLEVEFFLDRVMDVPPVKKYLQTSKNRVAHIVPVDDPEDVDETLRQWIKASYELTQQPLSNTISAV